MNKREASLILSLKYVRGFPRAPSIRCDRDQKKKMTRASLHMANNHGKQRVGRHQGEGPQGPPDAHAAEPPRPRGQPLPGYQGERGEGVPREELELASVLELELDLEPELDRQTQRAAAATMRTNRTDGCSTASAYRLIGRSVDRSIDPSLIERTYL